MESIEEKIETILCDNEMSDGVILTNRVITSITRLFKSQLIEKECEGCKRNKGTDNIYTCNCGTIENLQLKLEEKDTEIESLNKCIDNLAGISATDHIENTKLKQENKELREPLKPFLVWLFNKADRIWVEQKLGWRVDAVKEMMEAYNNQRT